MPFTTLAIQQIVRAGLTPSLAAANSDGSYVPNDGRTFIQVKNGAGAPITVTIETPGTVDGNAIADLVVTIPAMTGDKVIGPFPPETYNQSDGKLKITFSAVTTVTIGAFRL